MADRATWTDGDLLTAVEATHLASGQQAEFKEEWCTAVVLLVLGLTSDGARTRDLASARRQVLDLAVRIVEAEAARALSGSWKDGGPPALSPESIKKSEQCIAKIIRRCGATSPMAIRARTALKAVRDDAWLRRQLEGLNDG